MDWSDWKWKAYCRPCDPGERTVGNTCDACAANEKPVGDECVPCPDNELFSKTLGECVGCADGTGWNSTTETCEPCPMDVILSLDDPNVPDTSRCVIKTYRASQNIIAGDVCPNQFWVELRYLSETLDDGSAGESIFNIQQRTFEDVISQGDCPATIMRTAVYTRAQGSSSFSESIHHVNGGEWDENLTPEACVYQPNSFTGITRNQVQNGVEDVRIMQSCQFGAEDENCELQIHFLSSCMVE